MEFIYSVGTAAPLEPTASCMPVECSTNYASN